MKEKILFLCTGNSCRSQIAEGLAMKYLNNYIIDSAGINPEPVNPNAIKTMKNINIDISKQKSKKINMKNLDNYNLVVTLCGDAKDHCPTLHSKTSHIHWAIEDPAKFNGTDKEILRKFSEIKDMILEKIKLLKIDLNNKS